MGSLFYAVFLPVRTALDPVRIHACLQADSHHCKTEDAQTGLLHTLLEEHGLLIVGGQHPIVLSECPPESLAVGIPAESGHLVDGHLPLAEHACRPGKSVLLQILGKGCLHPCLHEVVHLAY